MRKFKGSSGVLFGIVGGAGLGVIGNFAVVTYYRVTDSLKLNSTPYDFLTFIVSAVAFFILFVFLLRKIDQCEAEEESKGNYNLLYSSWFTEFFE